MNSFRSRLRRHLSFANLTACAALFIALGGVSYAAATINGNSIKKRTIGAGKLKKKTLTSAQVKADGLDGSVIAESTLGVVPVAQTALNVQTATSATSAQSAVTAQSADTARHADSATTAQSAGTAQSAVSAQHADSADSADTAVNAQNATEANTVGGLSAEQLQVRCPANTELFGGMCWDELPRPSEFWIDAAIRCGEAGGRLPGIGELIAYASQVGPQLVIDHWSNEVVELSGSVEQVLARGETTTTSLAATASLGYRCVFYRVN